MKRLIILSGTIIFFSGLSLISDSCKKDADTTSGIYQEFTDARDGKVYKTIKVGNQTWFAENLNYEIPDSLSRDEEESWCYDFDPGNCVKYGRLYTWYAAIDACPGGWHLATDDDWKNLEMSVGMSEFVVDDYGNRQQHIGNYLKSKTGWLEDGNGNDSIGFGALPGGKHSFYMGSDLFQGLGEYGEWWTATGPETHESWARSTHYYNSYIRRARQVKTQAYSVRCVKD